MCSFTRTNSLFSTEAHMAEGSKINLVPLCRMEQDVESLCWSIGGLQPFTLGTYAWRWSFCTAMQTCYRGFVAALGRSEDCCCCQGLQPPPASALRQWRFCTPLRAPLSDWPSSNQCLVHSLFSEMVFKIWPHTLPVKNQNIHSWHPVPPRNIFSWVNFEPLRSRFF